jgi:hypothetical protein
MSAEQNIETARQLYEAFGRGDLQAILDRVTDDVDWSTDAAIASAPWYGPRQGTDGVAGFFEAIGKTGPAGAADQPRERDHGGGVQRADPLSGHPAEHVGRSGVGCTDRPASRTVHRSPDERVGGTRVGGLRRGPNSSPCTPIGQRPREDPPLTSAYALRGSVPGRRRPLCVRAHPAWSTDGGGTTHGRGRWERLRRPSARLCASDLAFQDACSLSSSPSSPGSDSGRVSWVPRASAIRWFAASDYPSMQCA